MGITQKYVRQNIKPLSASTREKISRARACRRTSRATATGYRRLGAGPATQNLAAVVFV